MNIFLIAEGVSDLAVLDNIIYSYYGDDIEPYHLQPVTDETTKKQINHGGWSNVIHHLRSERFYEDVNYSDMCIIQLDTDISESKGFDVSHLDESNRPKCIELLISDVIDKLLAIIIDSHGAASKQLIDKLVFCICVHSIECWLVNLHKPNSLKNLVNCHRKLMHIMKIDIEKSYLTYEKLSSPLTKNKNILALKERDRSFDIFINSLEPYINTTG